jgi:hypothetical protein
VDKEITTRDHEGALAQVESTFDLLLRERGVLQSIEIMVEVLFADE